MTEFKNDFFSVVNEGDVCKIQICSRFLDFEMISQCRDLRPIAKGRNFQITGRSSVEAYLCLGYVLTFWGAASIIGIGAAANDDPLRIDLSPSRAAGEKKWLSCHIGQEGSTVAEIQPAVSANGLWPEVDLELETPSIIPFSANGEFHLTGRGSVWMYMHLGVSAALAGFKDVFISKPVVPYEIHINSEGICKAETLKSRTKQGSVIGILGKPNSGKSVFSRNFAVAIQKLLPPEFTSWIYDCDLASPTPDWYLNDSAGTREIRESIKQKWTPDLERKAAHDLETLRGNLDLTLADMPGGRGHDADWQGIPTPTRAAMLEACDGYIVICKQSDQVNPDDVYADWHKALEEYHLEDRIVARIVSSDPEKDFTVSSLGRDEDGIFTATITGLDRNKARDTVISCMTAQLGSLIKYLSDIRSVRAAENK